MSKQLLHCITFLFVLLCFSIGKSFSQCPAGYTTTSLNWDNLDFLVQDATYISASQAQTQHFAFGTNKVTITHNYSSANADGENGLHTADGSSNGTGDDVQFRSDGFINVAFQTAVQNVKFSLYDIDYKQVATITALDGATPKNIVISAATGATLTLAGSNTTTASATADNTFDDNLTSGTVNVSIAGPITSFKIVITASATKNGNPKEDASFWLSDISACNNTAAFPAGYYAVSKPYTNQPGYVLSAIDNKVLMINPATGSSKLLFTDPSGNNINSLGYDPYNKFVYYTYSLTNAGTPNPNDKSIQKYDVNTGVISTVISNVNTYGIPTYTSGVESGGAAFYDGAYYIGIEGENGEESKIWRIDFDASFNAIAGARQVFGIITDTHDWGDFAISNGVLYDFDGKTSNNENINQINLQTGATSASYNSAALGFIPRQAAVDWTEKIYNTGTAATSSSGTIVPYNNNGTITTAQQYTITTGATTPSGSWGDAGEAFRPKADFGDAPASYDPDPLSPALHEADANLRLGSAEDVEWNKKGTSAPATDDADDGLPFVQILSSGGNYLTDVNVYNNTGANATLCAWVDFNNNGIFDTGEGITSTVASSTSTQTISLYWTGFTNALAPNSYTYLRIRLTSATNGMTTANPTGWFNNGEVEDYRVIVNATTLAVKLSELLAEKKNENEVKISWTALFDETNTSYILERSSDGNNWISMAEKNAAATAANIAYVYTDVSPVKPVSYYRLKVKQQNGIIFYSSTRRVNFEDRTTVKVFPNPASKFVQITIGSELKNEVCNLKIVDANGNLYHQTTVNMTVAAQTIQIPVQTSWPSGTYIAQLITADKTINSRFVINK